MASFNNFVQIMNKKYGQINPINYAKKLFKENIDGANAIVSVLSNTGIAGFKFHIPQSEMVKMESDITDYYTDYNNPVQDNIARKPVSITLNGLQGEYFYSVNKFEDTLAFVASTMKLCTALMPKLSAATVQIKEKYYKNLEAIKSVNQDLVDMAGGSDIFAKDITLQDKIQSLNGVDLFKLFQELYKLKSAQTRAFLFFQAMWMSDKPFTVETSWKRYDNMLIQSLTVKRDENADITDFTVTFKQMSFTQSQYTDLENVARLTRQQLMKKVNKGVDKGEKVEKV